MKNPSQPNKKEKAAHAAVLRDRFSRYPQWILPTVVPNINTGTTNHFYWNTQEHYGINVQRKV